MTAAEAGRPLVHPAFEPVRSVPIEALGLTLQEFRHRKTGAVHYHLACDHPENVFMVALRTVPTDSTGVAHILEHTALCGSERYPVRDPFFMMLRRSLNTFMNAFTSADWTAYPFASQNRKDFDNLLEVYLDAVFFSRLDPLDFAQEGHRIEFEDPENPQSPLTFKGVVFNEMKGAMSSVNSVLWQTLSEHLFPTTTYHYNSGGEPECIPDLSYEQLQAFYRTHYHPSNATFLTFGNIPAAELQATFEERALQRFEALDRRIEVPREQRFTQPQRVEASYAFDEEGPSERKTHVVLGWLLGDSTDLEEMLEAQLLNSVLLENSASPLQHALETSELGSAPSPMCGLEDSLRELVFCCGLEGCAGDAGEAVEGLVLETLQQVARDGVSQAQLEAVLHQLELHQREVGGDSYPYGLSLILQAIGPATHRGDPAAVLDLDPVIAKLRERIQDPAYLPSLARRLLIDNPHRVTLVLRPDRTLSEQRATRERARLAAIAETLDEAARAALVERAQGLAERQNRVDDASILPEVTLEDVPAEIPRQEFRKLSDGNGPQTTLYEAGTNGLIYQELCCPLPPLDVASADDEYALLGHYATLLTEVGVGGQSYLETQQRQSASVGGLSGHIMIRALVDDEQQLQGCFSLGSKALNRKAGEQTALLHDTLAQLRFDEARRIRELVSQRRARRDQAITGSGHSLAMTAACAGMSPLARLQHESSGLAGTRALRRLDDALREDGGALQTFCERLTALHGRMQAQPWELLVIGEAGSVDRVAAQSRDTLAAFAGDVGGADGLGLPELREARRELWLTNTQVNFCARAFPTVPTGHADAAPLTVLGAYLRNGYLHRAIREQGGAYGGGASHDSSIAAFRFFSYRDPRLEETLDDFDASILWLRDKGVDRQQLQEAILGVIGSLDKPGSPAGEARQDFYNRRFGRDHAQRTRFRQQVLGVAPDDLLRVAETYLVPEHASTAIISGFSTAERNKGLTDRLGLTLREL